MQPVEFLKRSSVNLAPVSQPHDLNADFRILNIGNDAIISHPVFPVIAQSRAYERLADASRIVEDCHALTQEFHDAPGNLFIEFPQLFLGLFFELNQPGQGASTGQSPWMLRE